MIDTPNRPYDKIAVDLVSGLSISPSWNQHLVTISDQLKGWPRAFASPEKKADTIIYIFINNYLPINMCPHFILSDNGTEFKNQFMDNILKQLGIDGISCTP